MRQSAARGEAKPQDMQGIEHRRRRRHTRLDHAANTPEQRALWPKMRMSAAHPTGPALVQFHIHLHMFGGVRSRDGHDA